MYARTRENCVQLAEKLSKIGLTCAPYHAGISAKVRFLTFFLMEGARKNFFPC